MPFVYPLASESVPAARQYDAVGHDTESKNASEPPAAARRH